MSDPELSPADCDGHVSNEPPDSPAARFIDGTGAMTEANSSATFEKEHSERSVNELQRGHDRIGLQCSSSNGERCAKDRRRLNDHLLRRRTPGQL